MGLSCVRGRMCELLADCIHHWLIAPPEGPTSPGRCLLYGATREFKNVMSWPYGKLSWAENLEFQRRLMGVLHQAGSDDGEYVA